LQSRFKANGMLFVDQGLISLSFYVQLLLTHIPKAQKNTVKLSLFFTFLGSACVKAAHKMLVKSTPENSDYVRSKTESVRFI